MCKFAQRFVNASLTKLSDILQLVILLNLSLFGALGNLVTLRVTRRKLGIAFFDQAGDSEMRSKMRSNTKRKDAF